MGRGLLLAAGIILMVGGGVIATSGVVRSGETTTTTVAPTTTTVTIGESLPGADEIQAGDLSAARAEIEKHLEINPEDVRARYLLALTHVREGQLDEAIAIYREILEITPSDFEAYFQIGNIQRSRSDLEGAAESFDQSLRLNSDFTAAKVALAETVAELGDLDKAAGLYFDVIEARPLGVHVDQIRVALARLLVELDQRENALIQLDKARAENPENVEAKQLLGELETQATSTTTTAGVGAESGNAPPSHGAPSLSPDHAQT